MHSFQKATAAPTTGAVRGAPFPGKRRLFRLLSLCTAAHLAFSPLHWCGQAAEIQIERDDEKHRLSVLVDGKEAFCYRYSPDHFLPYFFPVRSPSGKDLTVELTKPYPHHRSFWISDKVQLDGDRAANFYFPPKKGKGDRIRHDRFLEIATGERSAVLRMLLVWEMDQERPVLQETRTVRIVPLGRGEYFMDLRFTVTAAYGDVHFISDSTHYSWPYVRIHPQFSVKSGGTIVNSEGGVNQNGTHNRAARWCDYSNTIEGKAEGLAMFSHSENRHPHRWLTRDYGTFGPRRIDAMSGKRFTLKRGALLRRRVGVLVHNGDTENGRVAERYEQYVRGQLSRLPEEGK